MRKQRPTIQVIITIKINPASILIGLAAVLSVLM